MATTEDILKKAAKRKGKTRQSFQPTKHRSWDYLNNTEDNSKQNLNKLNKESTEKNGTQTVHKRNTQPITNGPQTEHKRNTQPITNGPQTEHKRNTNGTQNPLISNFQNPLSSLIGIQRKIVIALYENCQINGGNITQKMTVEHISSLAQVNKNSVKTTINRLKKKGCIACANYKDGRGGWTKYQLDRDLYSDLVHDKNSAQSRERGNITEHKRNTNGSQTVHKRFTQPITKRGTNVPSSSSINIITTTEEDLASISLSDGWSNINHHSLESFGFTQNHVEQIRKKNITTADLLQNSIEHFAFDLEENNKAKTIDKSPLQFFMGIMLRQGAYHAPKNYESPKNKAMRIALEKHVKEQAAFKAMQEKLILSEKQAWLDNLTKKEQDALLPERKGRISFSREREALLGEYFKENIWPEIAKQKYVHIFEEIKTAGK